MRLAFAALLTVHGLIHLLGVAKAFGLADLPQLTQPITPARGWLWLAAAVLCVAAAAALFLAPRWWWVAGLLAVAVSSQAIVGSWTDAKAGMVANLLIAVVAVVALAMDGPWGLRAEYDRDVRTVLARPHAAAAITEADLAALPAPVQRYLRRAGVVGQPRVWNVRVRMHGRIRSGPDAAWMPLEAEQHNTFDTPARLFYLTATMRGLPVDGYHRFADGAATMRIRAAGLVPVQRASGDEMTQAETVTLFNDMCLLAPATLVDPGIRWQALDDRHVEARFTHGRHTIGATLVFDAAGDLVDFWSDDRRQAVPGGGGTMTAVRWSTPVREYGQFGPIRVTRLGEARWHPPEGDYPYIELEFDDVRYNVP
ncbi:MAG: DUF6544 family protein [Dehalococcoidia bacterium]